MKTVVMKTPQQLRQEQRLVAQALSTAVGKSSRMWSLARRAQAAEAQLAETNAREKAGEQHDIALEMYLKLDVIKRCRKTLHELSRRGRRRSA